ncbi:O-linked N-acetylglucosamine transferase, SPINDLY family protein [Azospirillum sp. sgz301742]
MTDNVFLSAVKRLSEDALTVLELIEACEALRRIDRIDLAIQLYRLWIAGNAGHPAIPACHFNLSASLSAVGELEAARDALERSISINPDFYPAYINLGGVYEQLGNTEQALLKWLTLSDRLASITGNNIRLKVEALKQVGRVLEAAQKRPEAEVAMRDALEVDPSQIDVVQQYIALRMEQCKWPVIEPWAEVSRKALMNGIGPLSLAAYTDDPMLQFATALNYSRTQTAAPQLDLEAERRASDWKRPSGRLRIGYVSSDMREHAVGYLTAELFERHDRETVEVFIYYCGLPASDAINMRIKAAAEHWVDISAMDDLAAARRIAEDAIDILVDLNGYTRSARLKLFAMRPAPIIVNWLGYPGTLASPFHHYIIADDWIIPEDHEIYYSEKVLRLPCYQPNDRKRAIVPHRPTRAEAGLPEDAVVYCCFNGTYKINRFTFERWMHILAQVPNSVLWLLESDGATVMRLRETAERRGIAGDRLIFTQKLANPFHLARYPLADLFLDTAPYGAHTTASDALWMGVPILTLSGRGFASRVCGSLARAAGLPELVCSTVDAYVERAVALGNDPIQLQTYRDRLAHERDRCVLFDMDLLARRLEELYGLMQKDLEEGRLPRPDLDNLEMYREVGLEEDHESIEVGQIADYQGWYRARLASQHHRWPVPTDRRLWTAADRARAESSAPAAPAEVGAD